MTRSTVLTSLCVAVLGCGGAQSPSPIENRYPVDPAADAVDGSHELPVGVSEWVGEYTCAQGLTRLALTIERAGDSSDIHATFRFSAHPTNPGIPSGSFRMNGSYTERTGEVRLEPSAWLEQPEGWVMVGLAGVYDPDRRRIAGSVSAADHPGACTTFECVPAE